MGLKADNWIRKMALEHGMIEPFEENQVRQGVISYGLSSYGYDVRVTDEFKIFTNVRSVVVDPKNFTADSFVDFRGDVCIIPPNSFVLARTLEYFRIPRNVLTVCLGKSTYARCFRGDTRVALVDGTAPTLEEMAKRAEAGEMFWGYSIGENGRIIVTLLEAPRYIGRDTLVEVVLDNEESIFCTPDHQFMRRDGRWVAAGDLRPNDSLMPLYRELYRGYEMAYQPLNGHLYPTHRMADEWNVRHGVYDDTPATQRHHLDHERQNNNPWNLIRMAASEHIRSHHAQTFGAEFGPDEHRAMKQAWAKDDQRRAQQAEIAHPIGWHREITAEVAHEALAKTGLRRFPEAIHAFGGVCGQRNHKVTAVRDVAGTHDVYCLTVPEAGNFALHSGVFVHNCGLIVNVTPFEPGWEGFVTLEISNTTPLPAKVYAYEGISQVLFFEGDEQCDVTYSDRKGKYQAQQGIVLPRL